MLSRRALCSTRRLNNVHRLSSSRTVASSAYTNSSNSHDPAVNSTPELTPEQHQILDTALRVDQAGEVAANWIYNGQLFVLGRDPKAGPLILVNLGYFAQQKLHELTLA